MPQQFTITIKAPREKVWSTLWDDVTFRDWASLIDEGTYMKGELKEGSEIDFISGSSGYGVRSVVEKLIPNEHVTLRQVLDTKDSGEAARDDEWTGGTETFELTEHNGVTTLHYTTDVPPALVEIMKDRYPKALERIKVLAEGRENVA